METNKRLPYCAPQLHITLSVVERGFANSIEDIIQEPEVEW